MIYIFTYLFQFQNISVLGAPSAMAPSGESNCTKNREAQEYRQNDPQSGAIKTDFKDLSITGKFIGNSYVRKHKMYFNIFLMSLFFCNILFESKINVEIALTSEM